MARDGKEEAAVGDKTNQLFKMSFKLKSYPLCKALTAAAGKNKKSALASGKPGSQLKRGSLDKSEMGAVKKRRVTEASEGLSRRPFFSAFGAERIGRSSMSRVNSALQPSPGMLDISMESCTHEGGL